MRTAGMGWIDLSLVLLLLPAVASAQEEVTVEVGGHARSVFLSPVGDVFWWALDENAVYGWRLGREPKDLGSRARSSVENDLFYPMIRFGGWWALSDAILNIEGEEEIHGMLWDPAGYPLPLPADRRYWFANSAGVLAGAVWLDDHPVPILQEPGGATTVLQTTECGPTAATAVNDQGAALGRESTVGAVRWLFWPTGEAVPITLAENDLLSHLPQIANTGAVAYLTGEELGNAVLWYREADGTQHELGPIELGSLEHFFLSDSGVVAWKKGGSSELLAWDPENGLSEINPPDAKSLTNIFGVNVQGQVAGRIDGVPFLWDRTNGRTDMPGWALYVVLDDLGRMAWVEQLTVNAPWTLYLRHTGGTIETLAEGTSTLDEDYPIVALNALGQVAWADEDAEGNWTLYMRGPVDTMTDSDGDARSDEVEGKNAEGGPRDSDGDGTPDYLDTDSDNDGLGDAYDPTAYDPEKPHAFPPEHLGPWRRSPCVRRSHSPRKPQKLSPALSQPGPLTHPPRVAYTFHPMHGITSKALPCTQSRDSSVG